LWLNTIIQFYDNPSPLTVRIGHVYHIKSYILGAGIR
jgi:hypothetical protein